MGVSHPLTLDGLPPPLAGRRASADKVLLHALSSFQRTEPAPRAAGIAPDAVRIRAKRRRGVSARFRGTFQGYYRFPPPSTPLSLATSGFDPVGLGVHLGRASFEARPPADWASDRRTFQSYDWPSAMSTLAGRCASMHTFAAGLMIVGASRRSVNHVRGYGVAGRIRTRKLSFLPLRTTNNWPSIAWLRVSSSFSSVIRRSLM
jgi:hypothetical protein